MMNKFSFLAAFFLLSIPTQGSDLLRAPPSFQIKGQQDRAVFVDFIQADYKIIYDVEAKTATAYSTIEFEMNEEGFPIIDLVPNPTHVLIDGSEVQTWVTPDPDGRTYFRISQIKLGPGRHRAEIQNPVNTGLSIQWKKAKQFFFMSDLDDRAFLEQYVPASFEYDQVPMSFDIEVRARATHTVFTNGQVSELAKNHWRIQYPSYFTSSSLFYHVGPKSSYQRAHSVFQSIDGRKIPILVYAADRDLILKKFETRTHKVLTELEGDYGPFPHSSVTIYATKAPGGMEFSGATWTGDIAIEHELFHSYFARGVMPTNGDSGWMDEAFARWRDRKYHQIERLNFDEANLANRSRYIRESTRQAYTLGENFIAHLESVLTTGGHPSLKQFLREFFSLHMHQALNTQDFVGELERFYSMSFAADFKQYVYGNRPWPSVEVSAHPHPAPAGEKKWLSLDFSNQPLSLEELKKYL